MTFEIIIPLRNPTEVLDQSIASLVGQSDRNFSVLLSDNHSTTGHEHLESALAELAKSGIPVRKVQPPIELERVEHWNWAHYQSTGNWLKPLFVGDWLEPVYIERLRREIAAHSDCRYVATKYYLHRPGQETVVPLNPGWQAGFFTKAQMQENVLRFGMQFGPPSGAAYERTAFIALGGYPTPLPITSDSLFFCTLAAQFGIYRIAEPLLHFNIHGNRFSTGLPQVRRETKRETTTYYCILAYHAWTENVTIPVWGFLRLLARNFRS